MFFVIAYLPAILFLPLILPFKYLILLLIGIISIVVLRIKHGIERNEREKQKTIEELKSKYSYVHEFNRPNRENTDLLILAGMRLSVFLKLMYENFYSFDWKDAFTYKLLLTRLKQCTLNSFLGIIQWILYNDSVTQQKLNIKPIFILGSYRSGTTLLHHLLTANTEDFHFVNCLASNQQSCYLLMKDQIDELSKIHDVSHRYVDNIPYKLKDPQEDHFAISQDTGIGHIICWLFGSKYRKYASFLKLENEQDRKKWKASFEKVLKMITYAQNRQSDKRFVLKSPPYTAKVEVLLEMFPNAQFVFIHRDPIHLFLSTAKLFETFLIRNDFTNISDIELQDYILMQYKTFISQYRKTKHLIPEGNLVEIEYEELAKDKLKGLKKIYETLKLRDWEEVRELYENLDLVKKEFKKNKYSQIPEKLKQMLEQEYEEEIKFYKNYLKTLPE